MSAETVTFTKTVEIVDADKRPIREGSVLREISSNEAGIVIRIVRKGDRLPLYLCPHVGDLHIQLSSHVTRITNCYQNFRHVPHRDQTFEQRFLAWKYSADTEGMRLESQSADKRLAIAGIMTLLPEDVVNWEFGPWPDTIEDALHYLAEYLAKK